MIQNRITDKCVVELNTVKYNTTVSKEKLLEYCYGNCLTQRQDNFNFKNIYMMMNLFAISFSPTVPLCGLCLKKDKYLL